MAHENLISMHSVTVSFDLGDPSSEAACVTQTLHPPVSEELKGKWQKQRQRGNGILKDARTGNFVCRSY